MKKIAFALLFGVLSTSSVFADDPESDEANPDLIQTQGYVVFFDAQGPMSFATATQLPEDAVTLGLVHSEACQQGLSIPFTANLNSASGRVDGVFGQGGFIQAIHSLQKKNPDLAGIYNVQVDQHQTVFLTLYTRRCVEVTGFGYRLAAGNNPTTVLRISKDSDLRDDASNWRPVGS